MLSLIIPPIIIVIALTGLIYFFSRRLPALRARVLVKGEMASTETSHWNAFREGVQLFFLGMLEKLMRRSKLNFLKAHNFLSTLSEAMRKRREASREKILKFRETRKFQQGMNTEVVKQSQETNASKQIQSHWNVFRRGTNSDKVTSEGEHTLQEITVEGAHFTKKELPFSTQDAVETSKESLTPLVSDSVHDDVFIRRRRFGQSDLQERVVSVKNSEIVGVITTEPKKPKEQLEELLIGRIVSNPRDVEAYERLGDYYLENENYIDAKECYRQVLKLSPVNRLVKIKIRRLERVLEKQE